MNMLGIFNKSTREGITELPEEILTSDLHNSNKRGIQSAF